MADGSTASEAIRQALVDAVRLRFVDVSECGIESLALSFVRGDITVNDEQTQVLIEQTSAVAPERLGDLVGRVTYEQLAALNDGLRLVVELD
ncbi:MAG: hypothetical protein ACKVWR_21730 [Acidimicrobiales bacterium]